MTEATGSYGRGDDEVVVTIKIIPFEVSPEEEALLAESGFSSQEELIVGSFGHLAEQFANLIAGGRLRGPNGIGDTLRVVGEKLSEAGEELSAVLRVEMDLHQKDSES